MRRTVLLLVAILAATACQARMPLTRTEAVAAALGWCVREGKPWGDPAEVLPPAPGAIDADGRRWWTVRFAPAGDEKRIVLVNASSAWTKLGG